MFTQKGVESVLPRKPTITKTIKITSVKCLALNTSSKEVKEFTLDIIKSFDNDNQILRYINTVKLLGQNFKAVEITEKQVTKTTYTMTPAKFIKYANKQN